MRTTRILAAVAILLSGACRSSTAPHAPDAGTTRWVLHSANGAAAPALIHDVTYPEERQRMQLYVLADTIVLDRDTYVQSAKLIAYANGVPTGTMLVRDRGRVTRVGGTLHFESEYLQNVAFDGAVDAQGRLAVTQDLPREGTMAGYLLVATY